MTAAVLAGDIGGTKTNLALYAVADGGRLTLLRESSFASRDHASLEAVVDAFLAVQPVRVAAAAFGVAGPVLNGVAQVTNLTWRVEAEALGRAIGCPSVRLLNDLEAAALGALYEDHDRLVCLQAGTPRAGNRAVIAAGTGLGEALLFWDGSRHHVSPSEGGHADFAPRDGREDALLRWLRGRHGRVSGERVLSGPGLHNIFLALTEVLGRPVSAAVVARLAAEDPSAAISALALSGECATCAEALAMFVSMYGAQAGNLALTAMAVGGVYLAGGIAPKILPALTGGAFVAAFVAKDPHRALLEQIPVYVLTDPKTPQLGAAYAAAGLL